MAVQADSRYLRGVTYGAPHTYAACHEYEVVMTSSERPSPKDSGVGGLVMTCVWRVIAVYSPF
jgi:hypothetical protein